MVQSGHYQAAASFSSMTGQKVTCNQPVLQVWPNPVKAPDINKGAGPLTVVTTDIMGDMKGKSYLILNERECDQVYDFCTGKGYEKQTGVPRAEVLKELDNILSAAVITEFSNRLGITVYGDVPHIFTMGKKDIQTMVQNDFNEGLGQYPFIVTDVTFNLGGVKNCAPRLVWKLGDPFYSLVHKNAQKEYQNYWK